MDVSEANLRAHHVWVPTDSAFQRQRRLRQALWREANELPIGHKPNGEPLGSRIAMPRAKELLENYLTPVIRGVVRAEVMDREKSRGKLFGEPRIYDNLLSSQPLCFNLFGELSVDLDSATRVLQQLEPRREIERVTAIEFEHSPGRSDARYTGDRSAFDVFVEYVAGGKRGFLGIEVKYHEALNDAAAPHRARYDEIAAACGWWIAERDALQRKPLQQLWRDHLLAASLVVNGDYDEGAFVLLAPSGNTPCVALPQRWSSTWLGKACSVAGTSRTSSPRWRRRRAHRGSAPFGGGTASASVVRGRSPPPPLPSGEGSAQG